MEIDFSNDGGKRKDGVSSTHGSIMGVDAEPLVAIFDQWVDTRGRTKGHMEDNSTNILGPIVVQGDPNRSPVGEKDARSPTNIHFYNGESSHDQAYPSLQSNSGIQYSFNNKRDEYGSVGTLSDSMPREGANKGSACEDWMEFEDRSRAATLF